MEKAKRRRGWLSSFFVGTIVLSAVGCATITGSGKVVSTPVHVSSFSRLQVSNAFEVNVSFGDQEAVFLHVDDNVTGHLDVGVSNGTLHVGLKSRTSVRNATLKADVTAKSLLSIETSGASKVHLAGELTGQNLKLTASGASGLDGSVRMDEVDLSLSGASNAELSGSASRLLVSGSGASRLDSLQLQASDLVIELSGASEATVSVTGTISAVVSGASNLRYEGSPNFTKKDLSGASTIESI